MSKQPVSKTSKLTFAKKQIRTLSGSDLEAVRGGCDLDLALDPHYPTPDSKRPGSYKDTV